MGRTKNIKTYATGTIISLACCFGLLNVLLGLFGLTAALAYVNRYGDYIFFPAFAIFGTLLIYSLINWKKIWWTYAIAAITAVIMVYFAIFGLIYALIIIGGIVIAIILIKYVIK